MFEIMINVISPVFITIGLVNLLHRYIKIETEAMSRVVIYLLAPCLALDGLSTTQLDAAELGQVGAMVILMTLSMTVVGYGIAALLRLDHRKTAALVLSLILTNNANYGIPLNRFAYGETGAEVALIFYVVSATTAMVFAIFVALRGSMTAVDALKRVLMLPLTYAGILGVALNLTDSALPLPLARAINILGSGAVPLMLVILGIQLANLKIAGNWKLIGVATGARLMIAPAIALGWAALLGLKGVTHDVVIVQSAMSTAVMAGVIAVEFKSDAEFVTGVILTTTLASILTLSILISLL